MNAYVVNQAQLEQNIELLKEKANGVPIWAVIKGDGYGIGTLKLVNVLRKHGIDRFCVTEAQEAAAMRVCGMSEVTILMLRSVTDEAELARLLDLRVIFTVGSWEAAKRLNALAVTRGTKAKVHIKIDTGMGRYGFLPEESNCIATIYRELKNLTVTGIYTHFNCAFGSAAVTRSEFQKFSAVVQELQAAGFDTGTVHCCNSAAFLRFPDLYCDGVRLGSALLGRISFPTDLQPVGYIESQLEELRTLPVGSTVGYGAIWKAKHDSRIAVVPVGWYHGFNVSCQPDRSRGRDCFREALSALRTMLHKKMLYVEVNGKNCPVVGAIGMLHCTVDVSGIDCKRGDKVSLPCNPLHCKNIPVEFR